MRGAKTLGVHVEGSDAALEDMAVIDTVMGAGADFGRGIEIQPDPSTGACSNVSVDRSYVGGNHDLGVLVASSNAVVDATVIRDTQTIGDGTSGWGLSTQFVPGSQACEGAVVSRSLVENSYGMGVRAYGLPLVLDASIVRDTKARPADALGGQGVTVVDREGVTTMAVVSASIIERNVTTGVLVFHSDLTITSSWIRDTSPMSNGSYGDGLVQLVLDLPSMVRVSETRITDSARAGLSTFGGAIEVGGSAMVCNPIALHAQVFADNDPIFVDLGGNECRCGDDVGTCKVSNVELVPPEPLTD
ncbi:MAG: hypothetical protein JRI68_16705 [Deltaproteobacteria bacterium]|nr:hypothetical protein [Deltaproteobacteria bacterium]